MSKKTILEVITCPHCGREYLPAEIFVTSSFLGNPTDIDRDENGKIISFNGKTMDLNEKYICDSCNKEFKITTKISFKSFIDPEDQFNTEYVSPLHEKKITLFEE